MFAFDVMTKDVVTVGPEAKVEDVAALLTERRISGVPVVNGSGAVVGIVSEGDLVHRVLGDHEARRSWWLTLLDDGRGSAREYRRAHGRTAADVMSRTVISVSPYANAVDVARLLELHGIKRVPVIKDGKLVGIISRADVVEALAAHKAAAPKFRPTDDKIRSKILEELGANRWANAAYLDVAVVDGEVTCMGFVPNEDARQAVLLAAANTAQVGSVADELRILQIPLGYC